MTRNTGISVLSPSLHISYAARADSAYVVALAHSDEIDEVLDSAHQFGLEVTE